MRVGNFSLMIPQGRERDSGHVELPHGRVYDIKIGNHFYDRRCDAEVSVDGKSIGIFRISANGYLNLERGLEEDGRFTFFRAGSEEYNKAGCAAVASSERGLIQVTFKPEKAPVVQQDWTRSVPQWNNQYRPYYTKGGDAGGGAGGGGESIMRSTGSNGGYEQTSCISTAPQPTGAGGSLPASLCGMNASAGATGLTGHSSQSFYTVANLDYDPAGTVVISIRLVCVEHVEEAVRQLKPVLSASNPVPAPI